MSISLRPLATVAALLAAAALAAPPAAADQTAAAGGQATKPAKPQTQTKAAQTKPAAKKKVWTNADLEALRNDPKAQVLVLESKRVGSSRDIEVKRRATVTPQDVVNRYSELVQEADKKIAEIEKEKLAASNPFLRGLASQTGGPRSKEQIEADLAKWKERRAAAQTNLERASKLTGAEPEAR